MGRLRLQGRVLRVARPRPGHIAARSAFRASDREEGWRRWGGRHRRRARGSRVLRPFRALPVRSGSWRATPPCWRAGLSRPGPAQRARAACADAESGEDLPRLACVIGRRDALGDRGKERLKQGIAHLGVKERALRARESRSASSAPEATLQTRIEEALDLHALFGVRPFGAQDREGVHPSGRQRDEARQDQAIHRDRAGARDGSLRPSSVGGGRAALGVDAARRPPPQPYRLRKILRTEC